MVGPLGLGFTKNDKYQTHTYTCYIESIRQTALRDPSSGAVWWYGGFGGDGRGNYSVEDDNSFHGGVVGGFPGGMA